MRIVELLKQIFVPSLLLCASCQSMGGEVRHLTTRDGLRLAYEVSGEGSPTLVFIHGWACAREHWHAQVAAFEDRYTTMTVDVAGHGDSGANRETWNLRELGTDIAELLTHLNVQDVILIGHSMGGPVSLEAARLSKGRVLGVIGVDTLHSAEFQYPEEQMQAIFGGLEANYEATMEQMVRGMFGGQEQPELYAEIMDAALRADRKAATTLPYSFLGYDFGKAMRAAAAPIRCINAGFMPTEVELNREYADFDAVIMQNVTHFLMMERPDEFNAHLEQVIDDLRSGN